MTAEHLQNKRVSTRLTPVELRQWMTSNGISVKELSEILGVSQQIVKLWCNGQRNFSVTNSRLVRMFIKYPQMLREF